jgi:hypothetical protein
LKFLINYLVKAGLPAVARSEANAKAGVAQLARATAFQAVGCGFEPRFPLQPMLLTELRLACQHGMEIDIKFT